MNERRMPLFLVATVAGIVGGVAVQIAMRLWLPVGVRESSNAVNSAESELRSTVPIQSEPGGDHLELRDKNGRVRIVLLASDDEPAIVILGPGGEQRIGLGLMKEDDAARLVLRGGKESASAVLRADATSSYLSLFDQTSLRASFDVQKEHARLILGDHGSNDTFVNRIGLVVNGPDSMLWMKDVSGRTRSEMTAGQDGGSVGLWDKDEKLRAVLGRASTINNLTGAETTSAESSLVLFRADGKVLWQTP